MSLPFRGLHDPGQGSAALTFQEGDDERVSSRASVEKPIVRLPSTNSFISAKLIRSKFCIVTFIYPQRIPSRAPGDRARCANPADPGSVYTEKQARAWMTARGGAFIWLLLAGLRRCSSQATCVMYHMPCAHRG